MKPSRIRDLLLTLVPAREPVLLVGSPGIGKSDLVTAAARTLGHDLIVTHPVVDEPIDYKGMPAVVPGADGPTAKFLPFGELHRMVTAQTPTLVLMDDLGQAPPAVQGAAMQLVLARQINGQRISDHVSFVAATNRREDRAAVTGLITPLLDRFTLSLPVEFDLDDWVAWGIQNGMPVELLAYARLKPEAVNQFVPNRDMTKSPTPRSVAGLGRLVNLGVLELEALAGAAGESFAMEFLAFRRTWQEIPDRSEIYLNPDTATVPEKPDVLYALMGALAFAANPANFSQTVRYLARVPVEFSVACVKDAACRHPEVAKTPTFLQWAQEHAAVFSYDAAA